MKSLLDALAKVGIKPPFDIPSGFQMHPESLKVNDTDYEFT